MNDRTSLWRKAAGFAARKHVGQFRKDRETPYIAHPFRVAMTVRDDFAVDDPMALAAAMLHDVIEDTTADYDDLEKEFGREIADAHPTGLRRHVAVAPLWFVTTILVLLPAVRWGPMLRGMPKPGCCLTCGYDLRASPGRCPECGGVPEPASGAA